MPPDGEPAARRYVEPDGGAPEQELPRGDVTDGVMRVGDTVRRPHQAQSLAVAGYLDHLKRVGFRGARGTWAATTAGATSSTTSRARSPATRPSRGRPTSGCS